MICCCSLAGTYACRECPHNPVNNWFVEPIWKRQTFYKEIPEDYEVVVDKNGWSFRKKNDESKD